MSNFLPISDKAALFLLNVSITLDRSSEIVFNLSKVDLLLSLSFFRSSVFCEIAFLFSDICFLFSSEISIFKDSN